MIIAYLALLFSSISINDGDRQETEKEQKMNYIE
jgi:hypothetical protein